MADSSPEYTAGCERGARRGIRTGWMFVAFALMAVLLLCRNTGPAFSA